MHKITALVIILLVSCMSLTSCNAEGKNSGEKTSLSSEILSDMSADLISSETYIEKNHPIIKPKDITDKKISNEDSVELKYKIYDLREENTGSAENSFFDGLNIYYTLEDISRLSPDDRVNEWGDHNDLKVFNIKTNQTKTIFNGEENWIVSPVVVNSAVYFINLEHQGSYFWQVYKYDIPTEKLTIIDENDGNSKEQVSRLYYSDKYVFISKQGTVSGLYNTQTGELKNILSSEEYPYSGVFVKSEYIYYITVQNDYAITRINIDDSSEEIFLEFPYRIFDFQILDDYVVIMAYDNDYRKLFLYEMKSGNCYIVSDNCFGVRANNNSIGFQEQVDENGKGNSYLLKLNSQGNIENFLIKKPYNFPGDSFGGDIHFRSGDGIIISE